MKCTCGELTTLNVVHRTDGPCYIAEAEKQGCDFCNHSLYAGTKCKNCGDETEQEPVAWRNAALRVGEDLCSVGPFGYYDMTAEQWLDWALSVVTVHAPQPQRQWVGLTDDEYKNLHLQMGSMYFYQDYGKAIEAKLKEKNT